MRPDRCQPTRQLESAIDDLRAIVLDGLRHGFFECSISCEIIKDGKRRLVIRAGKSHQYTILPEDLGEEGINR